MTCPRPELWRSSRAMTMPRAQMVAPPAKSAITFCGACGAAEKRKEFGKTPPTTNNYAR